MHDDYNNDFYKRLWLHDFFETVCEKRKLDFVELKKEFEEFSLDELYNLECKKEICNRFYPKLISLISDETHKKNVSKNMQNLSFNYYNLKEKNKTIGSYQIKRFLKEGYIFKIIVYNHKNNVTNWLIGKNQRDILYLHEKETGFMLGDYIQLSTLELFTDDTYEPKKHHIDYDIILQ